MVVQISKLVSLVIYVLTARTSCDPETKYILDLPHCRIPLVPLFNMAVVSEFEVGFNVTCPKEPNISSLSSDGELTLLHDLSNDCCYTEILRPQEMAKNKYVLSSCLPFPPTKKVDARLMEFLFVKCVGRKIKRPKLKFHSQIPLKSRIREKLKYWKTFPADEEVPLSVMLLVLDAVQREHAVRSLPKTIEFMEKKLNFIDFKGHHSHGQSTFSNLIPIMLGTTLQKFPGKDEIDYVGNYDDVPFIWRNFSDANYITLHIEDSPTWHTFNFNGRTGFVQQPTDFYTRPYFLAQQKLNPKSLRKMKIGHWEESFWVKSLACVEDKLIYNYILDYSSEFLKQCSPSRVPSFSTNWLVWPHHDHFEALKTLDSDMLSYMTKLSSSPEVLENTVIIFLGDHGYKWSNYSDSKEGLLERNMALLKIRMPDRFQRKHPSHMKNLRQNSKKRVTSHVDLFKTLADIQQLEVGDQIKENYSHYGYDQPFGYSLFKKIPTNRTCKDAQVSKRYCGCNFPLYEDKFVYEEYKKEH